MEVIYIEADSVHLRRRMVLVAQDVLEHLAVDELVISYQDMSLSVKKDFCRAFHHFPLPQPWSYRWRIPLFYYMSWKIDKSS